MSLQPLTYEDRKTIERQLERERKHVLSLLSQDDFCSWHVDAAQETLERMKNRIAALERGTL